MALAARVSDMLHGDQGFGLARVKKMEEGTWFLTLQKAQHFGGIFGFELGPMNEPGLFHIFLTGLLKTREVIASPSPTTLTCKRCTGGAGTEEPPRVCRGQVKQDDTWMGHKMGLPKLPLQKQVYQTRPKSSQINPDE